MGCCVRIVAQLNAALLTVTLRSAVRLLQSAGATHALPDGVNTIAPDDPRLRARGAPPPPQRARARRRLPSPDPGAEPRERQRTLPSSLGREGRVRAWLGEQGRHAGGRRRGLAGFKDALVLLPERKGLHDEARLFMLLRRCRRSCPPTARSYELESAEPLPATAALSWGRLLLVGCKGTRSRRPTTRKFASLVVPAAASAAVTSLKGTYCPAT